MKKIVLLCAGSFNPITFMHLRLFVLAKDYLYKKLQWNVVGGLISPVHDAYKKNDLAPVKHRLKMVELSLKALDVPWIKLSEWEAEQNDWTRTLETLEYHQKALNRGQTEWFKDIDIDDQVQVMLLCGSDVVESFGVPGLWSQAQLETILGKFGVVCVTRDGSDVEEIIRKSPVLSQFKENIVIVHEWFNNQVSATKIREAVQNDLCIGLLVPMSVADYITQQRLYFKDNKQASQSSVFIFKAAKFGEESDPYVEALRKENYKVSLIPVLNFQFLGIPELKTVLFHPEQYSGIILTTPRAVEALLIALKDNESGWKEQQLKIWNTKPIYAIGEGTAALAENAGLKCLGQDSGCEAALAEKIYANKAKHPIKLLFPCGSLRLETLRLALEKYEIPAEFIEVYETSAHPELVSIVQQKLDAEGYPDVNLFFSPSGAQFMDEILRAQSLAFKQAKYAAIGPTTAEALKSLGYNVEAVAAHPDPRSVVDALKKLKL